MADVVLHDMKGLVAIHSGLNGDRIAFVQAPVRITDDKPLNTWVIGHSKPPEPTIQIC